MPNRPEHFPKVKPGNLEQEKSNPEEKGEKLEELLSEIQKAIRKIDHRNIPIAQKLIMELINRLAGLSKSKPNNLEPKEKIRERFRESLETKSTTSSLQDPQFAQNLNKIYSKYINDEKTREFCQFFLAKEIEDDVKAGRNDKSRTAWAARELAAAKYLGLFDSFQENSKKTILDGVKNEDFIKNLVEKIKDNIINGRKRKNDNIQLPNWGIWDLAAAKYLGLFDSFSEDNQKIILGEIKNENFIKELISAIEYTAILGQDHGEESIMAIAEASSSIQVGCFYSFPLADQKEIISAIKNKKLLDKLVQKINNGTPYSAQSLSLGIWEVNTAFAVFGLAAIKFLAEEVFDKKKDSKN